VLAFEGDNFGIRTPSLPIPRSNNLRWSGAQSLNIAPHLTLTSFSLFLYCCTPLCGQASGRYGHKELAPIENVRVGGDDELPITADIHPTVPAAPGVHWTWCHTDFAC